MGGNSSTLDDSNITQSPASSHEKISKEKVLRDIKNNISEIIDKIRKRVDNLHTFQTHHLFGYTLLDAYIRVTNEKQNILTESEVRINKDNSFIDSESYILDDLSLKVNDIEKTISELYNSTTVQAYSSSTHEQGTKGNLIKNLLVTVEKFKNLLDTYNKVNTEDDTKNTEDDTKNTEDDYDPHLHNFVAAALRDYVESVKGDTIKNIEGFDYNNRGEEGKYFTSELLTVIDNLLTKEGWFYSHVHVSCRLLLVFELLLIIILESFRSKNGKEQDNGSYSYYNEKLLLIRETRQSVQYKCFKANKANKEKGEKVFHCSFNERELTRMNKLIIKTIVKLNSHLPTSGGGGHIPLNSSTKRKKKALSHTSSSPKETVIPQKTKRVTKKAYLSDMRVHEMQQLAMAHGLEGYSKLRRDDLIALLSSRLTMKQLVGKA